MVVTQVHEKSPNGSSHGSIKNVSSEALRFWPCAALSSSVELANVLSEMESFRKAYFMLVKVDDNSNPTLLLEEEVGVNTDVRSESMSPVCLDIELQGQSRTRKFPSVDTTGSTLMQEFESKYATSF